MEKQFNYTILFNQALSRIKAIRAPRSEKREIKDLEWDKVRKQILFDFDKSDIEKAANVYKGAKNISISCLEYIVKQLLKQYEYPIQPVEIESPEGLASKTVFALKDCSKQTLLLFKEAEDCSFWKIRDKEPENIQAIMDQNKCKSCKYIYLMFDQAYLQVVCHNDDENDPGRGYNLYSLKWFFTEYFGKEEYERFEIAVKEYNDEVNDYIGYVVIKPLVPGSLTNFRRNVEYTLVNYKYENVMEKSYREYAISESDYKRLRQQFLDDKMLLTMLGNHDFSESLITAEWLFDSMKKAKAIDLTVIGMGYFKAVEQLLYDLICLHKNKNLQIRKDYSRKDLPQTVPLNDEYINDKAIDTTLGSMAVFVRDNIELLFRKDIAWRTRKFTREAIFAYADLRNGFFHKDNIRSMRKIEEIRDASYYMFFLLLGIFELNDDNLFILGYPNEIVSDYYRLCEYVDYHYGDIFFLNFEYGEQIVFGFYDMHTKLDDHNHTDYSGVYFKEIGKGGRIVRFSEENLPQSITLGKFEYGRGEQFSVNPIKVKVIYENGKYVGPSIAEDNLIDY